MLGSNATPQRAGSGGREKVFVLARDRELPEFRRFRVLSRVGEGATGIVYRAHDLERERVVALKVLHEATESSQRMLREEFTALVGMDHPNLVKLLDMGEEDGAVFVVMELVEGVDFVRYVRPRPGELDEPRLRDALIQCVVGLDQLHAIGKVHRDIKPSNVRVTPDGRVVILDFGLLADAHSGLSLTPGEQLHAGTAAYMAPEQALGDPVSPAADLYALGTMLYQALTGDLPYSGSAHDIRVAKVSMAPPDPRKLGPSAPDDLSDLCMQLLSMHPSDRPDARQVLTGLGGKEWIRDPGRLASLPPPDRIPFIGRASEVKRLDDLVAREKSATVSLHVLASAGVGKSALVRELARRLTRRDQVVWLEGTASPSSKVPFEPLHGIIEGLSSFLLKHGVKQEWLIEGAESLHELFPGLRRVAQIPHRLGSPSVPDRLERRWRALTALKHLLTRIAEERSLVIWIDGFHHADIDTVRVAERIFGGQSSPPLLLLLTSEPSDVSLPLPERQIMVLEALSKEETEALARKLTREDEDALPLARRLAATSGGHPLRLIELFRLVRSQGSLSVLPDALPAIVGMRREALSETSREVLDLLAIAETALPADVVSHAMSPGDHDLSRACAQLVREGFATIDDGSHSMLALAHPGLGPTLRGLIATDTRMRLEHALCDALGSADLGLAPLLVKLAVNCERLELAADAAFRISRAAGEVLAVDRAATYHSLAAELTQKKDALVQYQTARMLAESLADAGRSVEAAYAYQLAYQTSNAANALDLHRRSAELFVHSGHMEEAGVQCIRDALDTVGETLPQTQRSSLLSLVKNRAWLRVRGLGFEERSVQQVSARDLTRIDVLWSVGATLGLVDYVSGADFQTRGLLHALRAGERGRVARSLALEAAFVANEERPPHPRARSLLSRATDLAKKRRDPYLEGLLSLTHGMVEWSYSHHAAYGERALAAETAFRAHCTDAVWEVTTAQQLVVAALPMLGRFRELDERVQRYQQEALERGSRHVHASIELYAGFARILCLDDPKGARARVRDAASLFSRDRFVLQHVGETMALSWIDQYEQRPIDEARVVAARQGAKKSQLLRTLLCQSVLLNSEARLLVEKAQRDPSLAKGSASQLSRIARTLGQLGVTTGAAEAALWQAHARALLGDFDAVPGLLEQAEQAYRKSKSDALADAVSYRRARLVGGDAGKQVIQEVSQRFRSEGVRNPARLINAYVPAFVEPR